MVLRGEAQRQSIAAGHLRLGDSVLSPTGLQVITGLDHFFTDSDVYELLLAPDAEMETFYIDRGSNLLTKGKPIPIRNRRGGMKKKQVVGGKQGLDELRSSGSR